MPDQQSQPQPRPPGKPLWRRAYDAVEKQAAPPLEGAVRTATFVDAASLAVKLQSRVRRTVTNRTAQLLHLVNLPAASDITRLREQVALLDHELRRLRQGVEDAAQAAAANSPRATREAGRPRPDNPKPNRHTEKLHTAGTADAADAGNSASSADTAATADMADTADTADTSANSDNSGMGTAMPGLTSLDPRDLVERTRQEVERNALRARNGIKLAAGLDRPKVAQTPKDVVWRRDRCELWRYRNDRVQYSPPLFIVFSLVSRSFILDLSPGNSFIEHLRNAGFDVFLLDWGVAEERDAGNTLEDYCDNYIPAALRRALEICRCDEINVLGYCFGGNLALLSVAHNRDLPLRSLTTIATPVDMREIGLFREIFREGRLTVDEVVDDTGNIPPNVIKQSFRMLKPMQELGKYAHLLEKLWDDQYMSAYQTMTQWTDDHVPFPGAAARQSVDTLLLRNGFVTGELSLGGDRFSLADIRCPLLNVVALRDHIVPPPSALPLIDLVGSEDRDELRLDAGHIGLAVGRSAAKVTIPKIIDFLARRSEHLAESTGSSDG